jgi:hypothetical protein
LETHKLQDFFHLKYCACHANVLMIFLPIVWLTECSLCFKTDF